LRLQIGQFPITPDIFEGNFYLTMAAKTDNAGHFRKYVVEFIGTFFIVMCIAMTTSGDLELFAPMAIGLTIIMMVYAGSHVSGSHFNPAISLAVYLRGHLDAGDVLPYMVAQFLGSTLAVMLAGFLLSSVDAPIPETISLDPVPALIAELIGTILCIFVYLSMMTSSRTKGNPYFGIVIGLAYMVSLYTFQSISVGAFNPAIALGITMANMTSWSSIWIFVVANFAGGVLAAFLSQYVNGPDE
jgi:aquaporin Z